MVIIQILLKLHDTPHQSITFTFHRVKFLLHKRECVTSVITFSFFLSFCASMAPTSCIDQSTSKMKAFVNSSLTKIGTETNADFKIRIPPKDKIFFGQFKHQNDNVQIPLHIISIVSHQSPKGPHVNNRSRNGKICDNFFFSMIWLCPFLVAS